jgi:hypothetical protein
MILKNLMERFPIKGLAYASVITLGYTELMRIKYNYNVSVYKYKLEHITNLNSEITKMNKYLITSHICGEDYLDLVSNIPEAPKFNVTINQ